jgi:hypothetical protein
MEDHTYFGALVLAGNASTNFPVQGSGIASFFGEDCLKVPYSACITFLTIPRVVRIL